MARPYPPLLNILDLLRILRLAEVSREVVGVEGARARGGRVERGEGGEDLSAVFGGGCGGAEADGEVTGGGVESCVVVEFERRRLWLRQGRPLCLGRLRAGEKSPFRGPNKTDGGIVGT